VLSAKIPKSTETYIQECADLHQFPSQPGVPEQIQTNKQTERKPPQPVVEQIFNSINKGQEKK
jgi:hypothetical protein